LPAYDTASARKPVRAMMHDLHRIPHEMIPEHVARFIAMPDGDVYRAGFWRSRRAPLNVPVSGRFTVARLAIDGFGPKFLFVNHKLLVTRFLLYPKPQPKSFFQGSRRSAAKRPS